ncbi:MAG: hypothetical protein JRI50_02060 [Deltaproteobacteria bacterium]|nr:hypothetical protein [Deltaproteobacteria bacterium]
MLSFMINILLSAYTQVVLLFLLLGYFFSHRNDPRLVSSKLGLVRTIVLLLLFIYFLWNWASEIPPSLRLTSVLGMFLINLFLIKNVALARLERKYRDALQAYVREPEQEKHLDNLWHTGKRFYYSRYLITSLFSGGSPGRFLHGITTERVNEDIKEIFTRSGKGKQLISSKTLATFLKDRLAKDQLLPQELKDSIAQAIEQLTQHAWVEDQINEFLDIALEAPEKLR